MALRLNVLPRHTLPPLLEDYRDGTRGTGSESLVFTLLLFSLPSLPVILPKIPNVSWTVLRNGGLLGSCETQERVITRSHTDTKDRPDLPWRRVLVEEGRRIT